MCFKTFMLILGQLEVPYRFGFQWWSWLTDRQWSYKGSFCLFLLINSYIPSYTIRLVIMPPLLMVRLQSSSICPNHPISSDQRADGLPTAFRPSLGRHSARLWVFYYSQVSLLPRLKPGKTLTDIIVICRFSTRSKCVYFNQNTIYIEVQEIFARLLYVDTNYTYLYYSQPLTIRKCYFCNFCNMQYSQIWWHSALTHSRWKILLKMGIWDYKHSTIWYSVCLNKNIF